MLSLTITPVIFLYYLSIEITGKTECVFSVTHCSISTFPLPAVGSLRLLETTSMSVHSNLIKTLACV